MRGAAEQLMRSRAVGRDKVGGALVRGLWFLSPCIVAPLTASRPLVKIKCFKLRVHAWYSAPAYVLRVCMQLAIA